MGAPAVVAVVVTRNPGSWFEGTLAALAAQDYENLSILVVDNGSTDDPTPRVADVVPEAFVKRLKADEGFSHAANEAARSVEGAPFLLICHDDAAPAPDAVTQLVAEAFRANAGVVGAKLLDAADPAVLSSVGYGVDAYGAASPLVDAGELDQGQHDTARELFAVSDAFMLVRADLFETIAGFDERIAYFGEDVDLCWRARLAGAAVQFCPSAVAMHRGRFDERRPIEVRERLELRHQTRSMLSNYGGSRLLRVAPRAAVASVADLVGSVFTGQGRRALDVLAVWGWTLLHLPEIIGRRRRVKAQRRVRDSEYLPLMRNGSTRLQSLTRSPEGESRVGAATRSGRERWRSAISTETNSRVATGLLVAALVLLLVGARSLVLGELPSMREFTTAGSSVRDLFSQWWTAWRASGLGEAAVPPGLVPGLGALGTVLFLSAGAARRVLLLGPLVFGPIGAWRLFAGSRSLRAKAATLAVYGLSPIALNALGGARLQALVAWAAAPWVLRRVAAWVRMEPVDPETGLRSTRGRHLAGTALLLGLVCAVSPLASVVVVVAVALVLVGPALTGQGRPAVRGVLNLLLAAVAAALLNLPWLLAAVRRGDASTLTGLWPGRAAVPSAADMLTGSVGPVATGLLGFGLVVAAAVPLLTGRRWRFGWALGGWLAILAGLAAAVAAANAEWIAGAGVVVFLVPVALGVAVAVGMGPLAFEIDVVRTDFGIRQLLSFAGVAALLLGLVPMAVAATDGRWYLPEGDFENSLTAVDSGHGFRALWIGDPDVLPLSGWELGSIGGVNLGVSEGMTPVISQRFRLDGGSAVVSLRRAVSAAVEGRTARLGRVLAPMAIRYVVVVDRPAPQPYAAAEVPPPVELLAALSEQLDLVRIPIGPGVEVFRVTADWPPRADVTEVPPVGKAPPAVLGRGFGTSFEGRLRDGLTIAQAVSADPGWTMQVDGTTAPRSDRGAWAQQFRTRSAGQAVLSWSPPVSFRLLQAGQLLLLVALIVLASRRSTLPMPARRRRVDVPAEPMVRLEGDPPGLAPWSGRPVHAADEPDAEDDWGTYLATADTGSDEPGPPGDARGDGAGGHGNVEGDDS